MQDNGRLQDKLAVTGMDLFAGPWQGLDAYTQAVFSGSQAFIFDPRLSLWIERAAPMEVDLPELGLTPDQLDSLPTAKIAALLVASNALKNAGLSPDSSPRVCVVASSSPASGDLAGFISRHWDLNGPAVDISAVPDWTAVALEKMDGVLASGGAEFGLLVGVNIPAADLPDESSAGDPSSPPSIMYERDSHQLVQTHAAAAVVLRRLEDARENGDRIYAVIEASSTGVTSPANMSEVYTSAGAALPDVELIETAASGSAAVQAVEKQILLGAFSAHADTPTCALEGGAANHGDAGAAAGLLGMIRAALALYHRLIPAVPGWKAPSDPGSWMGSAFYVPDTSRTWFTRPGQTRRMAGVDFATNQGALSHLILSREDDSAQRGNHILALSEMRLFPVAGSSLEELLAGIDRLKQAMVDGHPFLQIARQAYQSSLSAKDAPFGLGLIAASTDDLGREIEFARKGLPKAFERGSEWQTPAGSYCTPVPVGRSGGVAFVYPGAFNTFLGLGKDLFQLFPSLYPRFAQLTHDMGGVLHETSLYPRRMQILSQKELDELEASLSQDPIAMLTSGIGLAVLYTRILRNVFGVHPQAAFGYSLGETSMLFALDIWRDGDAGNQRLVDSPVFHTRLAGSKEAVREAWGIPAAPSGGDGEGLWSNLLVMASPQEVEQAIEGEDRVYLTHTNTPRQVVIAGDPAAVQRVTRKLGVPALKAPFDHVLHCDPVRLEFNRLVSLYDFPIQPNEETVLYSAAGYAPVHFDEMEIARDLAETLCSPLDFPRLVNRVYADGARVFIEAGAGSNCSRWVDETLKGTPHLAVSVSRKGSDDLSALLRTLARLHSHRVTLDLVPLFETQAASETPAHLRRLVRWEEGNPS